MVLGDRRRAQGSRKRCTSTYLHGLNTQGHQPNQVAAVSAVQRCSCRDFRLAPKLQTLRCVALTDAVGRLCCKSRRYLVRSRKTGNIGIRRIEFLNQNSLFGLDLRKVFFAPGLKIVLQHYRPTTDSCAAAKLGSIRSPRRTPVATEGPSHEMP
jgi:hypothetical protein